MSNYTSRIPFRDPRMFNLAGEIGFRASGPAYSAPGPGAGRRVPGNGFPGVFCQPRAEIPAGKTPAENKGFAPVAANIIGNGDEKNSKEERLL